MSDAARWLFLGGPRPSGCPRWCAAEHGLTAGEEDLLHLSNPVEVAGGLRAQMCLSVDAASGVADGPWVMIGGSEYTLEQAEELGVSLVAIARSAAADSAHREGP